MLKSQCNVKNHTKQLANTKIYTNFVPSNNNSCNMIKEISEQENELIEAIRNY